MKIVGLRAENVKGLKCVKISPTGTMIFITGKNGNGKSSVLDCILWALKGTKSVQDKPVRRGQEKGFIELDLGENSKAIEYEVLRDFKGEASSLTLTGDGKKFPSPQSILDGITGSSIAFDPLAFSRMKPDEQFEQLRTVVELKIDPKDIAQKNEFDYQARARINKEHKGLEAQIDAFPDFPDDLPEAEIDVSAVAAKIGEASTRNSAIETAAARRTDAIKQADGNMGKAGSRIQELEGLLTQARADFQRFRDKGEELRKQTDEQPTDVSRELETLNNATELNKLIALRNKRQEMKDKAADLFKQSQDFTAAMAKRDKDKLDALASVKMPVKELSFGDGVVLFNGSPINQASKAERIKIGCALAMRGDNKLRVMRIEDADSIDDDNLKMIEELADKYGFQVWLEMIKAPEGRPAIIMEAGNAKAVK